MNGSQKREEVTSLAKRIWGSRGRVRKLVAYANGRIGVTRIQAKSWNGLLVKLRQVYRDELAIDGSEGFREPKGAV